MEIFKDDCVKKAFKGIVVVAGLFMKIEKGYHLATSSAAEAQPIRKMRGLPNTKQKGVRKRHIFQ